MHLAMQCIRNEIGGGQGNELGGLCGLRRCKLGAKDLIPKATRHAEAVLVICVVVLEVVFLELLVIGWKAATMVSIHYRAQIQGTKEA